ncbi:unnamed protein product [Cylicostephanus goldi]|uniref:Uncharacterized protein n=1 Tax=Cylicostephanus goldi TaxID=71465 RepID=A0A3P7N314_CYLGO|nr:unnamed protein product [Cylicostephanus goldi]
MAERLVKVYESPANKVKMPALTAEGMFYNRYLLLFVERVSNMEEIEKKYKELVPRLVGVSRQLTLAMADKLKALSAEHREEYSKLIHRLVDIWIEFSRFTEERQRRLQLKFSPSSGTVEFKVCYIFQGFARHSAMYELFEDALREQDPYKAATCLEILSVSLPRNKLEPLVQRIQDR